MMNLADIRKKAQAAETAPVSPQPIWPGYPEWQPEAPAQAAPRAESAASPSALRAEQQAAAEAAYQAAAPVQQAAAPAQPAAAPAQRAAEPVQPAAAPADEAAQAPPEPAPPAGEPFPAWEDAEEYVDDFQELDAISVAYPDEPVPAPAAAPGAVAAPAPAACQLPAYQAPVWPEPMGGLLFAQPEEPGPFDPASVILNGRLSASRDDEVRTESEQADATLELLCFRVATEDYAISIMDIKEIIRPREVTEVPRVPDFVRGILSLRGIIIPVFDMRLRLGLSQGGRSERERIVVVKRQGGFCGVLVDEVVQVVRIPEQGIEPPPVVLEGIDRDFVAGIGRVAGRMLILLDMEKVLDVGLL